MRKTYLEGTLVVEPKLEYLQQGQGKTLFMVKCILASTVPDSNRDDYFFLVAFEGQAKTLLKDFHENMRVSVECTIHSYRGCDEFGLPQIATYLVLQNIKKIDEYSVSDVNECQTYEFTNYLEENRYSPLYTEAMEDIMHEERRN